MWHQGFKSTNRINNYVSFKIKDTEVLIGPRLDNRGCCPIFFKSIKGFLVVTESYIEYPLEANVRWFPWLEGIKLFPEEVLYGSLKTLDTWINKLKLPRIYIHCDLGSHRAPSVLGAFLHGFFTQEERDLIVNQADLRNATQYYVVDGEWKTNPLDIISEKFKQDKKIPFLIKAIVDNPLNNLNEILVFRLNEILPFELLPKENQKEIKDKEKKKKRKDAFIQRSLNKFSKVGITHAEVNSAPIIIVVPNEIPNGLFISKKIESHTHVLIYSTINSLKKIDTFYNTSKLIKSFIKINKITFLKISKQ